MADLQVYFKHPTDGRTVTVTVDDTMTAQEAIGELLSADFIAPSSQGYNLSVKGGDLLLPDQSFAEARVVNKATLRVIPATDAGTANRRR